MDGAGILRVSGGRDLKGTQHYPRLFGDAVAQLFHQHRQHIRENMKQIEQLDYEQTSEVNEQQLFKTRPPEPNTFIRSRHSLLSGKPKREFVKDS